MRPDQDPRLTEMGMGEATCEKCMMELYSDANNSICDDCDLNAMKKGNATQFVKDVIDREASFSNNELLRRNAVLNRIMAI